MLHVPGLKLLGVCMLIFITYADMTVGSGQLEVGVFQPMSADFFSPSHHFDILHMEPSAQRLRKFFACPAT